MISLTNEITMYFFMLAKEPQIIKIQTNMKESCSIDYKETLKEKFI